LRRRSRIFEKKRLVQSAGGGIQEYRFKIPDSRFPICKRVCPTKIAKSGGTSPFLLCDILGLFAYLGEGKEMQKPARSKGETSKPPKKRKPVSFATAILLVHMSQKLIVSATAGTQLVTGKLNEFNHLQPLENARQIPWTVGQRDARTILDLDMRLD
jgi:hypothetical protein